MDLSKSAAVGRGLMAMGLLIALWGVAGLILGWDKGESGFFYGPEYEVLEVVEGGAAQAAGIQEGDRVLRVDGAPVEELPMQSRWWPRPVGGAVAVTLQRGEEPLEVQFAYGPVPADRLARRIRSHIMNLVYIGFGLWAFFSVGTSQALVFTGFCLARALSSFPGPSLGPRFEGVASDLQMVAMVAMALLLLRFLLEVPKPRRVLQSGKLQKLFWGVFLLFILFCAVELAVHPALYMTSGWVLLGLLAVLYLPLLVVVPWSWFNASSEERRDSGLNLILVGFLLGFGPMVLKTVLESAFGFTVPGGEFIPVVEMAFPFFLGLAVIRHGAKAAGAGLNGSVLLL